MKAYGTKYDIELVLFDPRESDNVSVHTFEPANGYKVDGGLISIYYGEPTEELERRESRVFSTDRIIDMRVEPFEVESEYNPDEAGY